MTIQQLRRLHNACHDYGKVLSGEFPNWEQTRQARKENRIVCWDNFTKGFLKITGENKCVVTFDMEDE